VNVTELVTVPVCSQNGKKPDLIGLLNTRHNKLKFLVKWEGYTNENNSWEPEDNCGNACKAIADFHHKYPQAPR